MEDVKIYSHLIITDVHEKYTINWMGKILDTNPKIENNKPIFVIVGSKGRIELNTTDMNRIEKCAKLLTQPKGKSAISRDTAHIYIKEIDDKETLMGILIHEHIKTYAPMFDSVGYY